MDGEVEVAGTAVTELGQGLMLDWLDVATRSAPERLALSFGSERWSFAELRRAVDAAAGVLGPAQRERGGRIGVLAANRPGFVFVVHAARRLGVAVVPINWRQTSDELAWQVRDADVGVLVVDPEREPAAVHAAEGLDVALLPIETLEQPRGHRGAGGFVRAIDLDAEAAVLYTSGTSGRPKGARLTYGNLWYSAIASALHLGHHRDDVWLAAMPLFHVGGLSILMRSVIGASPVVLQERFDVDRFLAALDDGATLVSVVPTMLRQLIDRRDTPWPAAVRCVLLGGSAAPIGLVEECLRRGIPVAPTYGLTEAASQVTTLLPDEAIAHLGSSGRPLPMTEVRIAGDGEPAVVGETGEIEMRGPTVFAGYLNEVAAEDWPSPPNPLSRLDGRGGTFSLLTRWQETEAIPASGKIGRASARQYGEPEGRDGWFRTGDAGYLDEDGYLFVVDRRDDLIVSGGENVYPAEIERVLLAHPAVRDAAVVGLPDAQWGARPVAIVVWNGEVATAEADVLAHCRERLAGYKVPRCIVFRDDLPRSASGKLLRRKLRDALLADGGAGL